MTTNVKTLSFWSSTMLQTESQVLVGVDQKGWKFPENHPIVKNDKGDRFFAFDVVYEEIEPTDVPIPANIMQTLLTSINSTDASDVYKALNAGLRLAQGDAVKAPYREKGQGKLLVVALQWAAMKNEPAMKEYGERARKDLAQAGKWLVEQYNLAK